LHFWRERRLTERAQVESGAWTGDAYIQYDTTEVRTSIAKEHHAT
jgi:hypothetical protein